MFVFCWILWLLAKLFLLLLLLSETDFDQFFNQIILVEVAFDLILSVNDYKLQAIVVKHLNVVNVTAEFFGARCSFANQVRFIVGWWFGLGRIGEAAPPGWFVYEHVYHCLDFHVSLEELAWMCFVSFIESVCFLNFLNFFMVYYWIDQLWFQFTCVRVKCIWKKRWKKFIQCVFVFTKTIFAQLTRPFQNMQT